MPTDYMYIMKCSQGEMFSKGELQRFGNIEMSPSAGVLNYGQVSSLKHLSFPQNLHVTVVLIFNAHVGANLLLYVFSLFFACLFQLQLS